MVVKLPLTGVAQLHSVEHPNMLSSFKIKLSYHLLKHGANSYVLSTMKIMSYHGNAETKDCVCFLHYTHQDHLHTGHTYKQFKKSLPVFVFSHTVLSDGSQCGNWSYCCWREACNLTTSSVTGGTCAFCYWPYGTGITAHCHWSRYTLLLLYVAEGGNRTFCPNLGA